MTPSLVLTANIISFGGLQGIQFFCFIVIVRFLDMGSQIAGAMKPLQSGLAVANAIETSWILYSAVAALAFLYYRVTRASVVMTSILSHEDALRIFFYRLTNHGYHLPSEL